MQSKPHPKTEIKKWKTASLGKFKLSPTWYPLTVGVGRVAVDVEAVADAAVRGEPGPEAEDGEELVAVVVLDDVAHALDGQLVLVLRLQIKRG